MVCALFLSLVHIDNLIFPMTAMTEEFCRNGKAMVGRRLVVHSLEDLLESWTLNPTPEPLG